MAHVGYEAELTHASWRLTKSFRSDIPKCYLYGDTRQKVAEEVQCLLKKRNEIIPKYGTNVTKDIMYSKPKTVSIFFLDVLFSKA